MTEMREHDNNTLLTMATHGNTRAWDEIVTRYRRLVFTTATKCGLSSEDAADVSQTVWISLLRHLHRINEPENLGGWLQTTTRREAVALSSRRQRERDSDRRWGSLVRGGDSFCEDHVIALERRESVRRVVGRLPQGHRSLIELVVGHETGYGEAAALLGKAIGTIGPSRKRILNTLARSSELARLR